MYKSELIGVESLIEIIASAAPNGITVRWLFLYNCEFVTDYVYLLLTCELIIAAQSNTFYCLQELIATYDSQYS